MKNNIAAVLIGVVFIILITIVVLLQNPQLSKNINIISSSNILLTTNNNIQNKNEHIESTETVANKKIETKNIDNLSQTDLTIQDKPQPVSRDEYMQQLKERAQSKYAEFLKNKQKEQKTRESYESEVSKETKTQHTTTSGYKPQVEIYTPKTQTTKQTAPQKYTKTESKVKPAPAEKPKVQTTTQTTTRTTQQQKTASTPKIPTQQSKTTKTQTPTKTQQPKTASTTKTQTTDVLKSNNVESALKNYLSQNVKFPSGYVIQVMFMFDKNLTISGIHITSIAEKDYYDGNDSYAYRFYTQQDEKILNNKVYSGNTKNDEYNAVAASQTQDGKFILELYKAIKKLGKSFVDDIPSEREPEFYSAAINYFSNNLYITVTKN